jgi:uncharacterized membrane protein YvlD (DUF360 family)
MKALSQLLMGLAAIAVILAIIGAFSKDIWLAATQWLLVAIVLGIAAMLLKPKNK